MNEFVVVPAVQSVELRPWPVPTHAVHVVPPQPRGAGMRPAPQTPVDQLSPEALEAMATAWIGQLYASAGRQPPRLVW